MERKKKILVADIEPLVDETKGNISIIAQRLGVSRGTVYNRIDESVTLERAIHDARQTRVDKAESALDKAVEEGNITAIIFLLKTLGKDRGYVERSEHEITGKGRGPIEISGLNEKLTKIYGNEHQSDEGTE